MVEQLGSIVAVTPPLAVGRHTAGRAVPLRPRLFLTPRRAIAAAAPALTEHLRLTALVRCDISLDDINRRVFFPGRLLRARVALATALARGATALTLDGFTTGFDPSDLNALATTLLRLKRDGIAMYVTCRSDEQARSLAALLDVKPNAETESDDEADDNRLAV